MEDCEHIWKLFHDNNLVGTGFLSFYCEKCLEMTIKEKTPELKSFARKKNETKRNTH